MKNLKKKRKNGFTLIELIVVIAILGILAAIAVPRFGSVRTDAVTSTHNANVRTIESAVNLYIANVGAGTATGKSINDVQTAGFLNVVPKVPKGLVIGGTTYAGTESYSITIGANGAISVTPAATSPATGS